MTCCAIIVLAFIVRLVYKDQDFFKTLMKEHVRAVVGVPLAAASSFCVLLVLETRSGPIEFQGLGFSFHGASGPAVIWIFAFLAFGGIIRILW
jgi:hypothetical protein